MDRGRDKLQRTSLSNRLDEKSAEDILINLPVKSLVRFKSVSKSWQSFIEDPSFIESYLSRSKAHPQLLTTIRDTDSIVVPSPEDGFKGGAALHKVKIPWSRAGMSNPIHGWLFCLVDRNIRCTRIYNLGTRQATPWAKTCIPLNIGASIVQTPSYGFGSDPLTNSCKVVCVWEKYSLTSLSMKNPKGVKHSCEVFRVGGGGGNRWRKIDEVPPVRLFGSTGVYANGSIYWRNDSVNSFFVPRDSELIVAFDVGTEKFSH
ncbi:F-box protein At3g61340-like [Papaver somniferum]|uniref:F-box protein At3g61340-like n=1 Tax=Papaver somniferum TaxID=3469 RepID=UPI000E6FEE5E|nr:F-box protein At3g61340-like [Papaver somniferum]